MSARDDYPVDHHFRDSDRDRHNRMCDEIDRLRNCVLELGDLVRDEDWEHCSEESAAIYDPLHHASVRSWCEAHMDMLIPAAVSGDSETQP